MPCVQRDGGGEKGLLAFSGGTQIDNDFSRVAASFRGGFADGQISPALLWFAE